MALNLNRVEVIGNLTRDPELRYTPNGQAVAGFAVATNRRYQDQTGNWVEAEPEFHEIVAWAKLGEGVNQALKKGDRVYLAGRLQTRSWEGQDGSRRSKTEIVADTIVGPDQVGRASFAGNSGPLVQSAGQTAPAASTAQPAAPEDNQAASADQATKTATAEQPAPAADDDEIDIEDIPF